MVDPVVAALSAFRRAGSSGYWEARQWPEADHARILADSLSSYPAGALQGNNRTAAPERRVGKGAPHSYTVMDLRRARGCYPLLWQHRCSADRGSVW